MFMDKNQGQGIKNFLLVKHRCSQIFYQRYNLITFVLLMAGYLH